MSASPPSPTSCGYDGLGAALPRAALPADSPEDAAVAVVFTSPARRQTEKNSTGRSCANIAQIRAVVDFSIDKILNALPLFHSFGLTAGEAAASAGRSKVFLYRRTFVTG